MRTYKTIYKPLFTASMLAITLSACGSAPKPNPLLEQARKNYTEAAADYTIVKHAPDVLDQARDSLNMANSKWKKKDHQWRVEHYAYLSEQRVKTARLISQTKETDSQISQMGDERRKLTLKVREAELEKSRREAAELKRQMDMLQAKQTERGIVLTLDDVLFDVDEASLAPVAARNIARIAEFMRSYPERNALIEGHTDSMGEADYNLNLSRERAFAVRDSLVAAGIDASRLSTQGFGETLPVAGNSGAMGRQANRRVEIIFPESRAQITEFDDF